MSFKTISQGVLVATLGLSAAAMAQDSYVKWTGGVGIDDRLTAPATGTKLVFFEDNGQYIADVRYTVKDAEGNVLVDSVNPGPWVVLDLPDGAYSVVAQYQGQEQSSQMVVAGTSEEYGYMFSDN